MSGEDKGGKVGGGPEERHESGPEAEESERDPIDLLAAEFTERLRRGEGPTISEYAQRHPSLAEEIRDLFPTIAAVERLKATRRLESEGGVALCGERIERLGDFRILREVGRGGMGIVYEAEQESLARRVAVKVLPRQSVLEPKHLLRFEREARMAAGLHHTNIVPVFGVGEHEGYHYYVMQFIDGVGLDRIIERLRQADERESTVSGSPLGWLPPPGRRFWQAVATIGVQAAEALDYAHSHGVLHRDVKPGNLLVDAAGVVWVTDFGLAKALGHDDVSQTGDLVGTLRYIAPEQLEGRVDARSDAYSLGLTLYEILTLRPAFGAGDRSSLLRKISQGNPPAPRKIRREIPRDLETIVLKAISRDPDHRYSSAGELAHDLRRYLEDRPIHARRTHPVQRVWRWAKRERLVASLSGAAVGLVVLVAAVATVGYVQTKRAMEGESREREKAESVSALATEALERIFERFAPSRPMPASDLTVASTEGEEIEVPVQPVLSREAAALLDQLLEFYGRLAAEGGDDRGLREKTADAYRRVGDIRQRLGDGDEARAAYGKALERYEELRRASPGEARYPVEIARIHNELGRTAWVSGEPGNPSHREALAVLRSVDPGSARSPAYLFELARTHYFLGRRPAPDAAALPPDRPADQRPDRPFGPRGQPDGVSRAGWQGARRGGPQGGPGGGPAGESPGRGRGGGRSAALGPGDSGAFAAELREAIRILGDLVEEHPTIPDYRELLALAYRDLQPFDPRGEGSDSTPPRERATEILRRLVADFPDVPDYRYNLAETLATVEPPAPFAFGPPRIGQRPEPGGLPSEVRPRLTEALEILAELVAKHPNVPDYASAQVRILLQLAVTDHGAGRQDDAAVEIDKAATLQDGLAERFPEVRSYRVWLALLRGAQARFFADRGDDRRTLTALEPSVEALEALLAEDPPLRHVQMLLVSTYAFHAEVAQRLGEAGKAEESLRKMRSLLEKSRDGGGPYGPGRRDVRGPPSGRGR